MVVLEVAFFKSESGQGTRAVAEEFVERCREKAKDVVSANIQADEGVTVEAVGQVCHVHSVQTTVRQL